MGRVSAAGLARAGIDAVALKPTEHRLDCAAGLPVDALTVDFEGREHVPGVEALRDLAGTHDVRVTVPVRADGFDPLGDDGRLAALPAEVDHVLVAGHPTYLAAHERARAAGPRLRAAAEQSADPWIGTEGIERLALAVGGTQFELLSGATERVVRELREAGVTDPVAVYAPTVLSADEDVILDAVGDYAARRPTVREQLADGSPTDSAATGTAREVLLEACRDYALAGDSDAVESRARQLRDAGVDTLVGYPARGLEAFLE